VAAIGDGVAELTAEAEITIPTFHRTDKEARRFVRAGGRIDPATDGANRAGTAARAG
jgi:hypothetical protein